jgi:hypothetical protein
MTMATTTEAKVTELVPTNEERHFALTQRNQ